VDDSRWRGSREAIGGLRSASGVPAVPNDAPLEGGEYLDVDSIQSGRTLGDHSWLERRQDRTVPSKAAAQSTTTSVRMRRIFIDSGVMKKLLFHRIDAFKSPP
jgi:hypothetical protein